MASPHPSEGNRSQLRPGGQAGKGFEGGSKFIVSREEIGGGMADLKANHIGELKFGEMRVECAVLDDGTRVISERGVFKALGKVGGGRERRKIKEIADGQIPPYLASKNLIPFIDKDLLLVANSPIRYKHGKGGGLAHGIKAEAIPNICNVWLKARDAGVLTESQLKVARNADLLMRGLAHVGITALVDEATGYQEVRDKNELHKILEAYISKEFLPWTKRFPDSFYEEMFRLKGWQYRPVSVKKPKLVGKLTADLVYEQLPKGVLAELRKKNPTNESGNRTKRHHQFLTPTIGNPHLEKQLISVVTLMRASPDWKTFDKLFKRAFSQSVQEDLFDEESTTPKGKK
jgi:hypothetical protein